MLDLTLSKFQIDAEYPVSDTASTIEEGAFLTGVMEDGKFKVAPCAGAAGEVFAGIAWGYFTSPTTAPMTETGKVDSSAYTFVMSQLPTAATAVRVYKGVVDPITGTVTAGSPITVSAATTAPASGTVNIAGNTLTFNADMAGQPVLITYRYALTAQQAASYVGDGITQTLGADVSGTIGVIERGRIFTSNFDTSVDWTAASPKITLAAGGFITIGGTGTAINGRIYALPTAESPFLGIQFDSVG